MRYVGLAVTLALLGCGKTHGGGGADAFDAYSTIELDPAQAMVTVALGGSADQPYKVYGLIANGDRTEITDRCAVQIPDDFGTAAGVTVTVGRRGGKTDVTALCGSQTGVGSMIVNLAGATVLGTAPTNAADLFATATTGSDAARLPAVEYPLDNAVSPKNLPPIDMQWKAGGNDLFHVHVSASFVALDLYTSDVSAMLSVTDWQEVATTAAGDHLQITVEGLLQSDPSMKFGGAGPTLSISNDNIDSTAIYYWASSVGKIMSQQFGAITPPAEVKGGCTSCHSLSRSGSRIGYSRCVGNDCGQLYAGFLKYNGATMTWDEAVNADNKAIHGSYTTFSPPGNPFPGDTTSAAIVALADGSLGLYDPDTGAALPSNLAVAQDGPGMPRSATMPYWSADGTKVVFASTPHPNQWIDLSDSRIAIMSYAFTGGVHTFGEPTLLIPDPITLPNGVYTNFFFPSLSPDDKYVVLDAARDGWRNGNPGQARAPGQRLMLAGADGSFVTDLTALNGPGDTDITWAHWAPNSAVDYYWVVFSSERDYGHRVTQGNTNPACIANGVLQCKQIWIGAIAKNRLTGATTMDPSAPPMWLPGQDTQTENISPYWTLPVGIQ